MMLTKNMVRNNLANNWIKYDGQELESGKYLICYPDTTDEKKCFMEEVYYLHKGDVVGDEMYARLQQELKKMEVCKYSAEEKLLDAVLGESNRRTITVTGFYNFHWNKGMGQTFEYLPNYYNVGGNITHIQFLPDCPPCYESVCDPFIDDIEE